VGKSNPLIEHGKGRKNGYLPINLRIIMVLNPLLSTVSDLIRVPLP
jgi:hypothetical protein